MVNLGDIIITFDDKQWIVFDVSTFGNVFEVVDLKTQKIRECFTVDLVKEVQARPENVHWLFMARREKEITKYGLSTWLK